MMIRCPECNRDISMEAQACPYCGVPAERWMFRKCPRCGKMVHRSIRYCENCHFDFIRMDKKRDNTKKPDSVLSILAALFGLIGLFLPFFAFIAGVLGIIDLATGKNDGKRHLGAWMGIVLASLSLIIYAGTLVKLMGVY